MEPSVKEEKALLSLLPVVVMWIKKDVDLSEQEIRTVARLHPKEFAFAKDTDLAEMQKFMERYKDNKIYRDLIDVVTSDKGWKWVQRTVNKCKGMGPLENGDNACVRRKST